MEATLKILIFLTALAFVSMPTSNAKSSNCPKGLNEWIEWKELAISKISSSGYQSFMTPTYHRYLKCKHSFDKLEKKQVCFENLLRFTEQNYKSNFKGYSMGLNIPDSEYFKNQANIAIKFFPSEILGRKFLTLLDKGDFSPQGPVYRTISDINKNRRHKILAFNYDSPHLASIDEASTFGRLFLYIPGEKTDLITQFNIGTESGQLPSGFSVIVVNKTVNPPEITFNDLWRKRKGGKFEITTRYQETKRLENCYFCHKSPFIPIIPKSSTFDYKNFSEALSKANQKMSSYSHGKIGGMDMKAYGPGLGISDPLSLDYLKKCSRMPNLNPHQISQIKQNIKCGSCHDGNNRGLLNYPSGLSFQIEGTKNLADEYIVNYQTMPPTLENLSPEVRIAISRCLKHNLYGNSSNNYSGKLVRWLKNEVCFNK